MKHSTKFLQQRKLIMALPLLITPFITMIFWALGGGQVTPSQATPTEGLNLDLPSAHFLSTKVDDKLSLYEEMQRDAEKFQDALENDPYYDLDALSTSLSEQETSATENYTSADTNKVPLRNKLIDPNEEKINRKLEELYAELNKSSIPPKSTTLQIPVEAADTDQFSEDVTKLERMMEMMRPQEQDPEMQQIDQVLEKILDIQHPERVKQKMQVQTAAHNKNTTTINAAPTEESWLEAEPTNTFQLSTQPNGFYGLDDLQQGEQHNAQTIQAVIHGTQEVVSGSIVKMRLHTEGYLNGYRIPKDQFIYGVATLSGERLKISITSIQADNQMIPVAITVNDLDGLEGIYIPGAIARDAAREATDQAVQGVEFLSMSPSLSVQAASAGMQAAKGFLGKKSKLVKVTVKAGHQIFLTTTYSNS
jgi:conjugative transposon TraM protein